MLVTFVSAWTVTNIIDINDRATGILHGDFHDVELANRMRFALARYNLAMLRYVAFRTDTLRADISLYQEEVHHWIDEARRAALDSLERHDLDSVAAEFRRLNVMGTVVIEALAMQGGEIGINVYALRYLPVYERLVVLLNAQREASHARSVELIESMGARARYIAMSTMIVAVAVLLLSIIASQKVLQIVLKPIRELTRSAQRVAEGDFRHEITVGTSEDELSDLVRHFNVMIRQLREYDALKASQIVAEQQRCETIVRDLTDVVVATDENHRLIYFNREAEDVIGLAAGAVVGRPLEEIGSHNMLMRRLAEDIHAGRLDGPEEIMTLTQGDRGERAYSYESRTIRNESAAVLGYLFRLKDVTKFKQLDEIKTKMVSTVSHELRTPLTSMGMSLELMLEDGEELDEMQHELLGSMQEDVKRLQMFVNDLLDLSRIESGKMRMKLRPLSPRKLADAAVQQVRPLAERQEIQIDTTGIGYDLPDILADGDRLAQVFNNLFSNAIRYTPYRGSIIVSAARDGGSVRFCVRDNGPGIPPGEERQIFEKFYQVRDDQRAGGSGLGLAIVKEILDAQGGRVWVESSVGWGSSFYFTLPVAEAGDGEHGG